MFENINLPDNHFPASASVAMRESRCMVTEIRAQEDGSRLVRGCAVCFDSPGYPYGPDDFEEIIVRGAITEELINSSDVVFCLEHDVSRGILGRSRAGQGTLTLELTDEGLFVSCELPNGAFGDQVLEGVRRGDYSAMSFCFAVASDGSHWERLDDGRDRRTITQIGALYDVSIVARPAYDATDIHVDMRGRAPGQTEETELNDNSITENDMPNLTDNSVEEQQEQRQQQDAPQQEQRQQKNAFTLRQQRQERRGFSLMRAIRAQMTGQAQDEDNEAVFRRGAEAMQRANLNYSSRLVLPVENRAGTVEDPPVITNIQVGTLAAGGNAIATETLDLLGPLYNNSVLAQAGATFLTGLVGNLDLPVYFGSSVGWEGETATASNGKGTFLKVSFSPKRLTAYIDVSNQFLIQDSTNAETLLRTDLARQIQQKLESTILGNAAGSTTQPAGLLNGVTTTLTPTYAQIVKMEKEVDEANGGSNRTYIMSPAIKAALRSTSIDTGSGRFLMEGSEINGIPALVTNSASGIVLGDFSELVICQWGGVEIIVDTVSKAAEGLTRIVVNSYWDAKPRRASVFSKAKYTAS